MALSWPVRSEFERAAFATGRVPMAEPCPDRRLEQQGLGMGGAVKFRFVPSDCNGRRRGVGLLSVHRPALTRKVECPGGLTHQREANEHAKG